MRTRTKQQPFLMRAATTALALAQATRRATAALVIILLTATTAWADITPTTPSQDGDGNYLIGNAAELYGFAEIVNGGNATANAKLTADIVVNENVLDANGEANTGDFVQWTPIGNDYFEDKVYSGTFDGQGHIISGLYVSGNGWNVGFVGRVSGTAVVKNLGIVDSYFNSSNNFLGSIVGGVAEKSSVTIANVYSTSTVKGENYIGGLVGSDGTGSVTIINSYFAGKTSASWGYGTHHDDLVAGDFDRSTLTVCNAFVLGTSQYGTSVTAEQLSDGTVAAALHYYQDALADGSMWGISGGKTVFSGTIDGVSVTTADITLHTFDGDATAYSSKYIVGNTTPLPLNVVRDGYTFFGWYDNADLEGDAVTQISSSENTDKEYWAKYERIHSVSFVLNGGTIQSGEIDHYIEGETTLLPTLVFKDGASFEGWYTTENFTGSRYYSIPSTATEDMTFYAKWGAEKTTFYLLQGGSPEPVNVLYEGENLVWLDQTTMYGYSIMNNQGNAWGGFESGINVPYTGGESTFGNGGRLFSVSQSGFYLFTLTDKGEGSWFVSVLYPLENYCTVSDIPDQTYTGSAITPAIDIETTLTLGTDYTIEYSDNTNVGTATATITGAGNYGGTVTKTFTIVFDPSDWADNGDGSYTIGSTLGWEVFCDALQDNDTYNRFSGKTVKLGGDIGTAQNPITRMAGSDGHEFQGNFDGDGHTLTFSHTATDNYCAPFRNVQGASAETPAVISNLNVVSTVTADDFRHPAGLIALQSGHVSVTDCNVEAHISSTVGDSNPHDLYPAALVSQASSSDGGTLTVTGCTATGTISTDGKYAAGLVGIVQGTASISDCISSVTIDSSTSGDGTHGGLVASQPSGTTITITGCLFDGRLLGSATSKCGGFIGYRNGGAEIYNSLFAPAEVTVQNSGSATFARNKVDTYNSYYTYYLCDGTNYAPYDPADADHPDKYNNGHATRTVAAAADVTIEAIALTGTATQYTVSGITAYSGGGLQLGETLYYGSGDQLSLTLSNSATGAPQGYRYDGYTASAGTLSGSTLTMPDADVTVSLDTEHLASTGLPVAVAYVDAGGTTQQAQAIALDGTEEELRTDGQEKWYFVGLENVSHTGEIDCWGNVHIILCDGKTMTANHSNSNGAFWGAPNSTINIYGQTAGTGTLNINGTDCRGIDTNGDLVINGGNVNAILTINHYGFENAIQANGSVTINGGTVTANATGGGNGIYGKNGVTINGGSVNATGGNNWYGISANVSVTINGGNVTATGGSGSGINANYGNGTITLGWNKPTDRIYASSYSGTVSVKDGLAFVTDEATPAVIGGTVSDLAAINGKTLKPATFYLVGNMTNPEWTVNADYQLTVNPGNTSELMIQNVPLTGSTEFKVVYSANGTEATTWYPGDGNNYWISADGIYDIYFRPDYQGGDDWHYGCIYATDVSNIEVAFAPEGFATYYHGTFDVKLPEGVKARIVTARGDSEGTLTYETIADGDTNDKVVPAGTAVMLQTEKSTEAQQKTLTLAVHGADSPAAPTLNLLHGSDVEGTTTGDGKHYKLTYGNDNTPNADVFGWYWGSADGAAFTSPAHKAWLVLPADANARSFFGLPDEDTTGIVNAEANSSLFTLHSSLSEWYTIDGMKLSGKPTAKGVYILNGRKIVIK